MKREPCLHFPPPGGQGAAKASVAGILFICVDMCECDSHFHTSPGGRGELVMQKRLPGAAAGAAGAEDEEEGGGGGTEGGTLEKYSGVKVSQGWIQIDAGGMPKGILEGEGASVRMTSF